MEFSELHGYIRAEEHLKWLLSLLGSRWRPKPGFRGALPVIPEDGGKPTLARVDVNYALTDTAFGPEARVRELRADHVRWFAYLAAHMEANGFEIGTHRVRGPMWALRARHRGDGFILAVRQGKRGNIWITATSPPVGRTKIKPPPPALQRPREPVRRSVLPNGSHRRVSLPRPRSGSRSPLPRGRTPMRLHRR